MSRFAVRISKTLTAAVLLVGSAAFFVLPARADQRVSYQLEGSAITFERIVPQHGARAVSIDDPGVKQLLAALAATVTWQRDQRYILVTTAEPKVISFALGDNRYDAGPVTLSAPFAPFLLDGSPFVPFDELLHVLGLAVKSDGSRQILQPQLTSLDVVPGDDSYKIVARGALPLDGSLSQNGNKVAIVFDGVGSTLAPARDVDAAPLRSIAVATSGTASHPRTTVTLTLAKGSARAVSGSDDQRDYTVAFSGAPPPAPVGVTQTGPSSQPGQAHVTAVQVQNENGGMTVRIALDGPAAFEWHRLRPPDNRVWIDLHGARLNVAPMETPVRVHQQNADTVRVAISLAQYQTLDVAPDAQGVTLTIGSDIADNSAPRSGTGTAGVNASSIAQATPAPSPQATWKYTPRPTPAGSTYVAANPRLIVIDPGHGGSDPGTIAGGYQEKAITLDVSNRVRDILSKRGWQVVMTREDDRDVYAPDDSASQELQARDDVANSGGARLFLSIHVNAFINSGPHGATVYYYKPEDLALARAVSSRIGSEGAVKDDGVVKDKLYVLHHADMPATLVETAYLTNPDDRKLLASNTWRQTIAQAIADGVCDYAGNPPPADGPQQ